MGLRLKKVVSSVVMVGVLLSGCGSDSSSASSSPSASATPASSPVPVVTDFHSVAARAETLARYVVQNDWDAISAFFASSSSQNHSPSQLQDAFLSASDGVNGDRVIDDCARMDGDLITGFATVGAGDTQVRLRVRMNENREVLSLYFEKLPAVPEVEETDDYTEVAVKAGRDPAVNGILTLPKNHDYPYIGILMPAGLSDGMDASGSDPAFRRQLAHALASAGVATIRYDMRSYEDPLLTEEDGWSLDLLMNQDLAWTIHHLDQYAVDATNIFYVGCGVSGGLGFGEMNEHYEMTKGLVLMDVPYADDGLSLFGSYYGLDEDTVLEARAALEAEEPDLKALVGEYPLSYWNEWNSLLSSSLLVSGSYRRLVLSDDEAIYDAWDQGTKRYTEMASYDSFTDEDGSMSTVAVDIAAWLDGEDLPSQTEKKDSGTTTIGGRKS